MFLHLGLSFPSGRLRDRLDRALVIAGYVIFPLAFVPALLFAGPTSSAATTARTNLLLIQPRRGPGGASCSALGARSTPALFVVVLRARDRGAGARTAPFERLQLTPVYVVRAAHVPARHRRARRRGRGRLVGGVRRDAR